MTIYPKVRYPTMGKSLRIICEKQVNCATCVLSYACRLSYQLTILINIAYVQERLGFVVKWRGTHITVYVSSDTNLQPITLQFFQSGFEFRDRFYCRPRGGLFHVPTMKGLNLDLDT